MKVEALELCLRMSFGLKKIVFSFRYRRDLKGSLSWLLLASCNPCCNVEINDRGLAFK